MRISDWSSDVCSSDLVDDFLNLGIEIRVLQCEDQARIDDVRAVEFDAVHARASGIARLGIGDRAGDQEVGLHVVVLAVEQRRVEAQARSEEHTSELQSLMRNSYAVLCLKNKKTNRTHNNHNSTTTIT